MCGDFVVCCVMLFFVGDGYVRGVIVVNNVCELKFVCKWMN